MTNDILEQCAKNVRDTFYLLMRTIGTEFNNRALSLREIITLKCINEERGASLAFLSEQVGCSISGASKLVDGLVELGYVIRSTYGEDRRRQMLTLTDDGHDMLETVNHEDTSYLILLLSTLSPAEREMIDLTMNLLREIFTADHSIIIQKTEQKMD